MLQHVFVVTILLQHIFVAIILLHVFVVIILLQHIIVVSVRIGCNNEKIKYFLLQRLRDVVTQIFVVTMNGVSCKCQIFGWLGGGGGSKMISWQKKVSTFHQKQQRKSLL